MDIQKNVVLAQYTTFNIGGPADNFYVANSEKSLIGGVQWALQKNIPFFILGSGANILVGDKGFRGLVIKNEAKQVALNDRLVTAESGVVIADLIAVTSQKGLSGFEHFAGIPSTIGGALWQNLHFLSPDRTKTLFIGDVLQEAKILEVKDGKTQVRMVGKEYFRFDYDYSILHDNPNIVLSAAFLLQTEDPKVIQERIFSNLKWREEKHPEYAWRCSAGSVFKKIEGYGAGRLIQEVGLKGYQINGAKFSEKHANFIVNAGNAKASDIRSLIELAQKKVKEKFRLDLLTEISFIGQF